eukprot:g1051.t1
MQYLDVGNGGGYGHGYEYSYYASNLTGTIPMHNMAQCTNISYISIQNQELVGTIPSSLGSVFHDLYSINMNGNRLHGTLPSTLANMGNQLYSLSFAYNQLTGKIPTFSDAQGLYEIRLQGNMFEYIPKAAFEGTAVAFANSWAFINLAFQRGKSMVLADAAFRGILDPTRITLAGSTVPIIPRDLFGRSIRVSDGRIILTGLGITKIEDGAFTSNGPNIKVRVDLRDNYIKEMSPAAFERGTIENSSECVDFENWNVYISEMSPTAMNCSGFVSYFEDSDNSCVFGICMSSYLQEIGAGGISPMRACCVFGGGYTHGQGIVMSAQSPVICIPSEEGEKHAICYCSSATTRYDLASSVCLNECAPGFGWADRATGEAESIEGRAGRCTQCMAGRFSAGVGGTNWEECNPCDPGTYTPLSGYSECLKCSDGFVATSKASTECQKCPWGTETTDAVSCSRCEPVFFGSGDCSTPVLGLCVGATLLLLVSAIFILVWRYRSRAKKKTDLLNRKLKAKEGEIEMLGQGWIIMPSEVSYEKPLAAGAFGEVWKGVLRDRYDVAIKKMIDTTNVDLEKDPEIQFLRRARHPRLVMFLGCGYIAGDGVDNDDGIFLVLEYCDGGDLAGYLNKKNKVTCLPPTWKDRMQLLCDVAEGMAYLHDAFRCIHRDLKSGNCLLSRSKRGDIRAKVADFGLTKIVGKDDIDDEQMSAQIIHESVSKARLRSASSFSSVLESSGTPASTSRVGLLDSTKSILTADANGTKSVELMTIGSRTMTSCVGTPVYMAPEIMKDTSNRSVTSKYSGKVDVYSFSMIMVETLELNVPWCEIRPFFIYILEDKIRSGERPRTSSDLRKHAPKGYCDLMELCWDEDPASRPTFATVFEALTDIFRATFPDETSATKADENDVEISVDEIEDTASTSTSSGSVPERAFPTYPTATRRRSPTEQGKVNTPKHTLEL